MVSAGVTGPLARIDAKRPPFVIAKLLKDLLEFRDSLLNTFDGASIDVVPPGLSKDMVQVTACLCMHMQDLYARSVQNLHV